MNWQYSQLKTIQIETTAESFVPELDHDREWRVLIVEDDPLISLGLSGVLEVFGYSVCGTVQTGEEAVACASQLAPDVILMDINLREEMSGIEATQIITAKSSIPVIYLTAQSSDQTYREAMHSQHYGYLIKPFDACELWSVMKSTCQRVCRGEGAPSWV